MSKPIKVPFHGSTLYIVEHNGEPYTPLKPIVEGIGLDWTRQYRKVTADMVRWGIAVKAIPSRGGKQEAACIPLRKLAGWLMTLHPSRVKPELRDKITAYQNECDDALWKYWNEGTAERRAKPGAVTVAVKPVPQERAGKYHYPRKLLEQPYFTSPKAPASLGISMLGDTTQFVSPLFALLNELRSEGHDVSGPWDEAVAMREAIQRADKVMEEISLLSMKGRFKHASTAGN